MGTTHILSNHKICIHVNSYGAELTALINKDTNVNYLWNGNPDYWGRYSPVLFPIVGKLKDNSYTYRNKVYTMKQHGFARDSEFELLSIQEHEIWFRLSSTKESYTIYPFDFILDIGYKLEDSKVVVMWQVTNTGTGHMYFSIGAHPAFMCPLYEGENQWDYGVDFHSNKPITYLLLDEAGYISDIEHTIECHNGVTSISKTMFNNDALIIEDNQTKIISLINTNKEEYVRVEFDAPVFGLWSPPKKNAPFVCIEPWYGRSDSSSFHGNLNERKWSNQLESGQTFNKSYTILII